MNCIKSNQIPSRLQGPLLFGEGRPLAWAGCRLCPPHWQPSWPVPFTAAGDTWEKHGFAGGSIMGGVCSGQSESDSVCSLTFHHQSPPVT